MSSGLAGTYFTLLQQFDQKAIPEPTGANTQIQKVAAPTDSAMLSDTSLVTTTVQTPPFKYGVAKYGQTQYGSTYKDIILADNPVAYYRLDEKVLPQVLDWSPNENNGTIYGGVTLGQPGAIADGDTAMSFDGSTGYVEVSSLSISGTFTVEAWVNTNVATSLSAIMGSRGADTFDLKLINGNTVHGDIGDGTAWITTAADASLNYAVNTWYHIVQVVTSTSYTTYANGTQIGTGTFAANTPLLCNSSYPLTIGRDGMSASEYASGLIDEVAIYNYALSAEQVQRHYNAAAWK